MASTALRRYDGLDERIAAHSAKLLKAGAPAGRQTLPLDLIESRREKMTAAEDLRDAEAAAELLHQELATATANATAATAALALAADAILLQHAGDVLVIMRRHEDAAAVARATVCGLLRVAGASVPRLSGGN